MAETKTGFYDISLSAANTAASGRGNLTAQLALIKADLTALTALVNDLKTKHALSVALANDLKAKFNAHTHNADGSQAGAYFTSPPRSDAATVTAGTAGTTAVADTSNTAVASVTLTAK